MEQVLDWLNENELRAYPLLDRYNNRLYTVGDALWEMPDNFLLDLQLILLQSLEFNNATVENAQVFLKQLIIEPSKLSVIFSGGYGDITTFEISDPATKTYPYYARNADSNLAVFGEGVKSLYTLGYYGSVLLLAPVEPSTCT